MIRLATALVVLAASGAVADPVMRFAVGEAGFDLEPEDILQAEAEPTDLGAVVFFRFAPGPSEALRDLTARSLGQPLDLIVCGQVLMSPIVMEVIVGGMGQINMGEIFAARELSSVLHGDRTCADYRGA